MSMQQALKRIKNSNIDLLVPKIYSNSHALQFLEGIVSQPQPKQISPLIVAPTVSIMKPNNPTNIEKLKINLQKLRDLKQHMIEFNLRDIVDSYRKQYQNSFRQLASKDKTISMLLHDIQVMTIKHMQQQSHYKDQIESFLSPNTKEDKQIQVNMNIPESTQPKVPKVEKRVGQLNRFIYNKVKLYSEETKTFHEDDLKDITQSVNRVNQNLFVESSINVMSSIGNSRSRSTLTSRRDSLDGAKPIKQKEFAQIVSHKYIQSEKARQLKIHESNSKSKFTSNQHPNHNYKGKYTLALAENKPSAPPKLLRHKS